MDILHQVGHALMMSFGMMWQTGWTLVLGFTISSLLQTVVPAGKMREALGRGGPGDIAAATALGAAAIMRTLFKKGAALSREPRLPLRVDQPRARTRRDPLSCCLGWAIHRRRVDRRARPRSSIMSVLVKLTLYPKALVEEARRHEEEGIGARAHGLMAVEGRHVAGAARQTGRHGSSVAQNFAMEWSNAVEGPRRSAS